MARVVFTQNIQRHVSCPEMDVAGETVRSVLEAVFQEIPRVRDYVVDEHGALRHHMVIFVDGDQIKDRSNLSDSVGENSEVYVMQALSGGAEAATTGVNG